MKIFHAISLLFASVLLLSAGAARAGFSCDEPVQTSSGLVRGEKSAVTATCEWKGIPYAAPPVGELRWRSPQPHPEWLGVRDALRFGDRCMQKGIMELSNLGGDNEMSEDCLYLNVYRPRKSGTFPVMVWIHGGGYTGGAGHGYRGDVLAESGDIMVVTLNYRMNVFGFLAHPDLRDEDPDNATGGQGSLDQVAAIKWVHENIENFGGDPDNITIFGESAGGWSVCTMLATPLNQGLFHRAVLESGGCAVSRGLEDGYEYAKKIAKDLGCGPDDIECLRALPAEKVLKKAPQGEMGVDYIPHHDGYLLVDTPLEMIRSGAYNQVSFMAGSNRDEFGKIVKLKPKLYYTRPAQYEKRLVKTMGFTEEEAARLAQLYPLEEFGNRPVEAFVRMNADNGLGCGTYQGLLDAARQQDGTYLYRFDYDGQKYGKYMGSFHALEIPFVFGYLDDVYGFKMFNEKNMDEARGLSHVVQGYWVNFARTGDPNGPALPEWPEFDPDDQKVQILDTHTRTESADEIAARCEFWDNYDGDGP